MDILPGTIKMPDKITADKPGAAGDQIRCAFIHHFFIGLLISRHDKPR